MGCGFSLVLTGCGANPGANPGAEPNETSPALDVVQVTTLTTVQASSGLFLSPSAQQDLPGYVTRGDAVSAVAPQDGLERAKVDVAVLFQGAIGSTLPKLTGELSSNGDGEWSPIEHYFPAVESTHAGAHWPLQLLRAEDVATTGVSTEWSGWQAFGGLGVRAPGVSDDVAASAAVATLDFEVRGATSPLILGSVGTDLTVGNRSQDAIERALLIYSHAGGVGVTVVSALSPGQSAITMLGPKEHWPEGPLAAAHAQLREFFAASVGDELGAAMADAKSIPFLETYGLRLISLLDERAAPTTLEFSQPATTSRHVVISHSEILKVEEEDRVMSVVADASLEAAQVTTELGRFSEGKLEYAAVNGDEVVAARAASLLEQLRRP